MESIRLPMRPSRRSLCTTSRISPTVAPTTVICEGGSSGAETGFPATCAAKKQANRVRHSLYPIRKAVPSSTIARSTVMAYSALREEIQWKPMPSPVSLALMTPASGETCQGVVGCRFVATANYRSTYSISIGSPPFVTRRNTAHARKLRIGCRAGHERSERVKNIIGRYVPSSVV